VSSGPAEKPVAGGAREIIPPGMAAALLPLLPAIAQEMAREIQLRVPEYARTGENGYASGVLAGSERTLRDFLGCVAGSGPAAEPVAELFRRIAQREAQRNRSLDALQAAMHVGAEVLWQRLSGCCVELGIGEEQLRRLAQALLRHFRENAAAAVDGYVQAQAGLAGQVQRHQRHLLDLLLSEPPVAPHAIESVAAAARWRIPDTVAAVVLLDGGRRGAGLPELPAGVLAALDRPEPCLVVPDPARPGRVRALESALRGRRAVVGPPTPLSGAAKSLRWARQAAALAGRGLITGPGMIHCVEHMSTLVIFQNEDLLDTLAAHRLTPLAPLRPAQRDRLADTLLAWLQCGGDAADVAARLHVHPQTVRYRIRQLQELFGDRLRDADVRLELELVLRARLLRARAAAEPVPAPHPRAAVGGGGAGLGPPDGRAPA
jgi:hypothetical protein